MQRAVHVCLLRRRVSKIEEKTGFKMTARGYALINGVGPQLRRMTVEIRLSRSGVFFSRFGKILDVLGELRPDWFYTGDMKNGLVGSFISISSGLDISFTDNRIALALAQKPDLAAYDEEAVIAFATDCDFLYDVYENNVQPKERIRIGFRQFYEAEFGTEAEANQWVLSLGLANPSESLMSSFDGKAEALTYSILLDCETYKVRINVEAGKKDALIDRGDKFATVHAHLLSSKQDKALIEAEKKSAWMKRKRSAGASVDFDSFIEAPTNDILIGEFIRSRFQATYDSFVSSTKKVK